LSCEVNIFLTIFGLDLKRLGLVQAVLRARGLTPYGLESSSLRSWSGTLESADQQGLINSLMKLQNIAFDLEVERLRAGERVVYTPSLGLGHAAIDELGCINLTEHRIREIMAQANQNVITFGRLIDQSLLVAWDAEFESFREQDLLIGESRRRTSVA